VGTPTAIDGAPVLPLLPAIAINLALVLVFGLQHSVMARPGFKRLLTKVVPEAAERSTYCVFTVLALALLFWQWQPMGGTLWKIEHAGASIAIYTLYAAGWMKVVGTTFLINHFDLLGLRQVTLYALGKEFTPLPFKTPLSYSYVRHPLYVGWLTVFWATPTMTAAHFLFAAGLTVYILIAIPFEERDLVAFHGKTYEAYRKNVPMLLPRIGRRKDVASSETETEINALRG
jgi:protein-S-isoprenylcysteine O-methyltransferase Ste14